MATGYTRQSSASILAGQPVAAGPVSTEFDLLVDVFALDNGHAHDGTAAGGAYVPGIQDTGDTKFEITGNAIEITISGTMIARIIEGEIRPVTGVVVNLGELANRFGALYATSARLTDLAIDTGGSVTFYTGATIELNGIVMTGLGTATATGEAVDYSLLNTTIADNLTIASTSTTSNAVGSGDLTFVIADSMDLSSGPFVTVSDTSDAENYVFGQIITWTSGTKTAVVRVHRHGGSGTKTSWNFNISGHQGPEADTSTLLSVSGDTLNSTTLDGTFTAATGSSLDINGTFNVENTGAFQSSVTVGEHLTITSNLTVGGTTTLTGNVTASGDVTINGDVTATTGSNTQLYNVVYTGGDKMLLIEQTGLTTGSLITLSETGNMAHNITLSGDVTINILPAKTGEFYTRYANIIQDSAGGRILTFLFNSGAGNTGGLYFDDGSNGVAFDFSADGASITRTATMEVFVTHAVVSVGGNYKAIS